MSDEREVDIQTVASIDSVGAIAYARGVGEAIATMYTSMLDHGLTERLASAAVVAYLASRFGVGVAVPGGPSADYDEDDEDEDEEDEDE